MAARLIAVACLVLLVYGCASTASDQSARTRALQGDLDAARAEWQTKVGEGYYRTSVSATQDLVSRYEEVYGRWSTPPDVLTQALLAYAVALADRVDRHEIGAEGANALLAGMKADMDAAKGQLASSGGEAGDAAMLRWWTQYWTAQQGRYAGSTAHPVACAVSPGGQGPRVTCS